MQCTFSKINLGASVSIQVTVVEYYPAKTSCELATNNIPMLSGHATVTSARDETALPE